MLQEFKVEIVVVAVILILLFSGANFFQSQVLNPDYLFGQGTSVVRDVYERVADPRLYSLFKTFLVLISTFFITIIAYCSVRMFEIRKKEHAHMHHEVEEYAHHQKEMELKLAKEQVSPKNEIWNNILRHLLSSSPSDWKLAILEADTMLEDLASDLGFRGNSLGDRLKMANQDTFKGLSSAWEVHTIRNRIAHEGSSFELSQHEAKRVIALYEQIFRQYGYV